MEHRPGDGVDLALGRLRRIFGAAPIPFSRGFGGLRQAIEADLGGAHGGAEAVGQPAPVGRPVEAGDVPVGAAVHYGGAALLQIHQDQLVAVIGEGQLVVGGGDLQLHHPAQVQAFQAPGFTCAGDVVDLQGLLPGFVAHHHQMPPVVEPVRLAVADAVPLAVLNDRAFVIGKGEDFAPGGHGDGLARGVEPGAVHVAAGVHKFAVALDPGAVVGHVHLVFPIRDRVVDVEIGAHVVDDAAAIAAGVAHVVGFVVGMAMEVAAVRSAAIEVADALVVADEENAGFAGGFQPHG
ncbi:MAG: hypothetical protein KatS3mg050_1721 [Litorilinea sp.]|nr:MAG: hypothetical protein KatS3mg050_1721 [Litorilinea sp.]